MELNDAERTAGRILYNTMLKWDLSTRMTVKRIRRELAVNKEGVFEPNDIEIAV